MKKAHPKSLYDPPLFMDTETLVKEKHGNVSIWKKKPEVKHALVILNKAMEAGHEALKACTPHPMSVVELKNPFDPDSGVKESWNVPEGVCGFAWIQISAKKGASRRFINELKQIGVATSNINDFSDKVLIKKSFYHGGFMFWVSEGGQSYERKMAYAKAFAVILKENDIACYSTGRLD